MMFLLNEIKQFANKSFFIYSPYHSDHLFIPSGLGFMCALEMLSSAGLINYFGRVSDISEVAMAPILMQKGNTKLALYGLSSVKDERLHRLFVENKVVRCF